MFPKHLCVCVYACTLTLPCDGKRVEVRGQPAGVRSVCSPCGPRGRTQNRKAGSSKHLHPPSHLTGPSAHISITNNNNSLIKEHTAEPGTIIPACPRMQKQGALKPKSVRIPPFILLS